MTGSQLSAEQERDITSAGAGDASWGDGKKEGKARLEKKKMGGWTDGRVDGRVDR